MKHHSNKEAMEAEHQEGGSTMQSVHGAMHDVDVQQPPRAAPHEPPSADAASSSPSAVPSPSSPPQAAMHVDQQPLRSAASSPASHKSAATADPPSSSLPASQNATSSPPSRAAVPSPSQPETSAPPHVASSSSPPRTAAASSSSPTPITPPSFSPSSSSSSSSSNETSQQESKQLFMVQEEVSILNSTWERPKNIEYVGEDMSFTIDFSHMLSPDQMKELQNKFSRNNESCMVENNWEIDEIKDENKEKKGKEIEKDNKNNKKDIKHEKDKNTWGKGIDFKWNAMFNNMSVSNDNSIDEFLDNENNEDVVQLSEEDIYEKPVFYAEKCNDPGYFILNCKIGESESIACLIDTGASFNVMSIDLYHELGLKNMKPTLISLCLADQKSCKPAGKAEDIILAIEDFRFPLDFMILDTPMDPIQPIVLGRPFLASGEVEINTFDGTITLHIGDQFRIFSMLWIANGMKYPEMPLNELEEALQNIKKFNEE